MHLMFEHRSHGLQAGCLTTDEITGQLPSDKCVLAYSAVLKLVFSWRHDSSFEKLLGGYVTLVLSFLRAYVNFTKECRRITQKWVLHHHPNVTWFLCDTLRAVSWWSCESCGKASQYIQHKLVLHHQLLNDGNTLQHQAFPLVREGTVGIKKLGTKPGLLFKKLNWGAWNHSHALLLFPEMSLETLGYRI